MRGDPRILSLAVLLGCLGCRQTFLLPALEPPTSNTSKIVFSSDREGEYHLYVAEADGSNPVSVGPGGFAPRLDRSGSWIAYFDEDEYDNVYMIKVPSSGGLPVTLLDEGSEEYYPSWSPDGSRIAYSSMATYTVGIFVIDADGSGVTVVTDDSAEEQSPCWSRDGSRIYFCGFNNGTSRWAIGSVNADGTDPKFYDTGSGYAFLPDVCPITGRVVFTCNNSGHYNVWMMQEDGTGVTRVTDSTYYQANPRWSQTGRFIYYDSMESGNGDVYRMRPDGSDIVNITDHPARDYLNPHWWP